MSARRTSSLVRALIRLFVPREEREYFLGDLEESFKRGGAGAGRGGRSSIRELLGAIRLRFGPGRKRWSRRPPAEGAPQASPRPLVPAGDNMLSGLSRDVRFGLRMLARSPGYTLVALFTMALGIGASTAIFSIVNGVLLKPIPYPESERIVYLMENNLSRGWSSFSVAPRTFLDWQERNRTLELMGAYAPHTVTYTGGEQPRRLTGLRVFGDYLEITGGHPTLGRGFTEEDMTSGGEGVVILFHGFWQESFGGSPDVLGRTMTLDGQPFTVVGVLPEGWRHPFDRSGMEVLLPLQRQEAWSRYSHFLRGFGRMMPGVTVEQAQADLSAVAAQLEAEYPDSNEGWGVSVSALEELLVQDARPQLLILLASVGLVLLIACVNVAQMGLARGSSRGHEMAIRTALGAGRSRVIRQLLVESLLVAAFGGALGVLLAVGALGALAAGWPQILPRMDEIEVDSVVLSFTVGLSVLSGLLAGVLPALRQSASRIADTMRRSSWSVTQDVALRRLRSGLVVVEVGLALMLLVGSGLLMRSFFALQGENPGFASEDRLTFSTPLPESQYPTPDEERIYGEAVLERLSAIPGVESVALTTLIPVTGDDEYTSFEVEGHPPEGPEDAIISLFYRASAGYFETMGIPMVMGRDFSPGDREGGAPVAVVSESFVRAYIPDEDPIGKRVRISWGGAPWREIVGVAEDVQHYQVGRRAEPQVYLPFSQRPDDGVRFVLRTSVPPLSLVPSVRAEIEAVDPDMPLERVRTIEELMEANVAGPRFRTILLTAFGLSALLLAAVGVYGVIAYTVGQRSREFGMRMALGAEEGRILRLVLRDGAPPVAVGLVLGIGGSLALTRVLESLLFGVGARDPGVFATAPLVLVAVAALAMLVPAMKASRVDPVQALTSE